MSDKYIRNAYFVVLILSLLAVIPAVSAGFVYYSLDSPVTSPEGLTLELYTISGESPEILVGDEITAKYLLHYESTLYNQLVIDQPGGLFFDITDPDGYTTRLGRNNVGKTIDPDDYYSVTETFSPDKAGIWKISPSYTILPGSGINKKTSPENWKAAEINVIGIEEPKPDLIIENINAEFSIDKGIISRIAYTIKNIGNADSSPSSSIIYVDGAKNGTESSVGYLPVGESLTIFEPAEIKYSGSTTLIEAEADYNKKINESSYENNSFEVIIENPVPNSNSESNSEFTDKTDEQKSDVFGSDTVLNNNQNSQTCPVQQGCSDICFICGVVGLLSILLCVLSFTLGYFYGQNKNCEREVRWMRSKIDFLRNDEKSEKMENKSKNDNIAEEMEEKLERAIEDLKEEKEDKK